MHTATMSKERYVAAIEVSSSKIMAVVGKVTDDDGHVEVIATEQERGVEGALRHRPEP